MRKRTRDKGWGWGVRSLCDWRVGQELFFTFPRMVTSPVRHFLSETVLERDLGLHSLPRENRCAWQKRSGPGLWKICWGHDCWVTLAQGAGFVTAVPPVLATGLSLASLVWWGHPRCRASRKTDQRIRTAKPSRWSDPTP